PSSPCLLCSLPRPATPTLFPYTTLFRSLGDGFTDVVGGEQAVAHVVDHLALLVGHVVELQQLLADVEVAAFHLALRLLDGVGDQDRKSTRLNSSHVKISYAVFCLKKTTK